MADMNRPERHGPWGLDPKSEWIECDGRAWGVHLFDVDTDASLAHMMDHLERKEWCTTAMLGEFWVAVRHWLWRKRNGDIG
jgi:hypothetical protein